MEKKNLWKVRETLSQCGFDQVISGNDDIYFCFGKCKIDPKLGCHLYQANPIISENVHLVLRSENEVIR